MPHDPPTPPTDLPTDVVDRLDGWSPELLRKTARYAEALAEHEAREARLAEESGENGDGESGANGEGERPGHPPKDVPAKATVTVKEINDNRYYYWQWRDGDEVKSKYAGPVSGDE